MTHEQVPKLLEVLANQRRLADVALQACHRALENAREEARATGAPFCAGRSLADLVIRWEAAALVFKHHIIAEPFLETRIGIYVAEPESGYFEGLRPLGSYRLITDFLTGSTDDDYLELLDEH